VHHKSTGLILAVTLLRAGSCREIDKVPDVIKPLKITAKEFDLGLTVPLGLAIDPNGLCGRKSLAAS
jgi:hypothetical protein